MHLLDPEGRGYVSCDNMSHFTVGLLKKISDILDPDPANTENYEYLHFSPALVR